MGFFSSTPSISVADAAHKVHGDNTAFIDVRSAEEYASGHAVGAQNYPLPALGEHIDALKKFSEVYVICQSGGRSSSAVSQLIPHKINAINVSGGTSAWRAAGLSITS